MSAAALARAVRNNAEWCDVVCATHGRPGTFGSDAWSTPRRAPRAYPDAVTLAAAAAPEPILARVDAGTGCSVKDSFAALDLEPHGFRVLFEAEWIARPPARAAEAGGDPGWRRVETATGLAAWGAAWAVTGGMPPPFRSELLARRTVAVLVLGAGDAGAVLNFDANAVGLTNVFANDGDTDAAWTTAIRAAAVLFPDAPMVGYESGDDLAVARRHGFSSLGPLRVWIDDER